MAEWIRRHDGEVPPASLLERKAYDFRALMERLGRPLPDDEFGRFYAKAASALLGGRLGEADKSLAQAELQAIDGATDLSALPRERIRLIGETRTDRAALSFMRTRSEDYREAASRYAEAATLLALQDPERSRAVSLEQARAVARLSEDFGSREGYDEAIPLLRRLLKSLDRLSDTVLFAEVQETLAATLENLAKLTGEAQWREQALAHCRDGLDYLRSSEAPALWRALKLRFGRLAVVLGVAKKDDNLLEEAIASYAGLLASWSRADDEPRWLEAEHMISRARATLGKRRTDLALLERAFNGLTRVVGAVDRQREPVRWAEIQDQMGGVLTSMAERYSEPVVLEEAIKVFDTALNELSREKAPLLWARTCMNQAEAMLQLARRSRDLGLAQRALAQMVEATNLARQSHRRPASEYQARLADAGALVERLMAG